MTDSDAARVAVTGVGTAVVDYIGLVEHHPLPDSQVELQSLSRQSGGNVATALASLSRLGVGTAFLGKFGDDELGRFVHADLTAKGIDLTGSLIEPGGSMGFAFIIVEASTARRTILWSGEGKSHLQEQELNNPRNRERILSSRYLHLDHYSMDAAIAAARIARSGDVQVVLDAESLHPDIDTLLPMVDVLIVCLSFAQAYTGTQTPADALQALYSRCAAHTVAITAGERGSYCHNAEGMHRQAAYAIDAVDTTGCGDAYHGAFIYGLIQAWPLSRIAAFASATAALNSRAPGGQSGLPDLHEVEDFLASARELPQSG